MGIENPRSGKGMQGRFDTSKAKARDKNGNVKNRFRPPQRTSSVVVNRVGEVETKPRQEQKVVPRGGVKQGRNPQISTESSNNTMDEGITSPISTFTGMDEDFSDSSGPDSVTFNPTVNALAKLNAAERKTQSAKNAASDFAGIGVKIHETTTTLASAFTHYQAKVSDTDRGGNADRPRNNKFKVATPQPPATSNGIDQDRVSYNDLNLLFLNKFLTNKLYFNENNTSGFNLVAYNITLFTLPANVVLGHRINEVAMKGLEAYKKNAIIITQTAGTDEFYIEGLSFKTTIGTNPDQGTGTQPTDINITIKAPTNNDFIDLLIKASIVGGWKDHLDMPMFIHVEWNGRSTVDDAPIKQINKIFRCFPVRVAKAGAATLDEGGSTYEFTFVSYRAQVMNNQLQSVQEDMTVSGYTVGEILAQITTEMYKLETNGKDVHLIPDEIYIEFPEQTGGGINKIKDYKMVQGKGKFFDNVAGQRGEKPDKASGKTAIKKDPSGTPIREFDAAKKVSDTQVKAKAAHTADLNKSVEKVTINVAVGTRLTDLIIKLVSNTVEAQALISGLVDPSSPTAAKDLKNINENDVIREFIQIESDVILKEYDMGRRKYATKNYIKVFENDAPSFSETQQATTTQTKGSSVARLKTMLGADFIRKCYHHMYTGLNTEIKGLEWTFDNLIFTANQLYSGIVSGYQQRQHGIQVGDAKQGAVHLGVADTGLTDMRVFEEVEKKSSLAVKTAETEFEAAKKAQGGPPGTANQTGVMLAAAKKKLLAEQKRHNEEIKDLNEAEVIRTLQGSGAKVSNKVRVVDTSQMGSEAIIGLIKGLGPNSRAFQKGNGALRIITWEPASLPVALGRTTFLNDINDKIVEDAIDQGVMFPVKFASSVVAKTEGGGLRQGHDRGKNIFSEIYQSRNMSMVKINLSIRGDPYWWPKIYQGKQLNEFGKDISVTPSVQENYCIIIADQSNTYDPGTGVMQIRQRNSMNGVYLVVSAAHNFSEGEYSQELELSRATSIDLNTVFGGKTLAEAAKQSRTNANALDF